VVALLGVSAYGTFAPASQVWGSVISRGPAGAGPAVALTFDDGPTPGATDAILDELRDLGVVAAFFVIGCNAARSPELVGRMHAEGHVIGNHTYDHSHYGLMRRGRYWRRQLDATDAVIEGIVGRRPALFRPPMGIKTPHVMAAARRSGHAVVTWNRRAMDGVMTDTPHILRRLLGPSRPGDILMLHDGLEPHARRRDPAATVAAVRPLVAGLRAKGLEIRRLDHLLRLPAHAHATTADA
jgi:peptidoglycan/xylan/chitin deacetylase (PgdA/CDA1 family)